MQTFLPYRDYYQSIYCLDLRRAINQVCRETITLLRGGWPNHPASRMWRGHEHDLALYGVYGLGAIAERTGKQYQDTLNELMEFVIALPNTGPPKWLGREDFHASHRSNLLRKDPEFYGVYGWTEPDDLPYVWPCISEPKVKPATKLIGGRNVTSSRNSARR